MRIFDSRRNTLVNCTVLALGYLALAALADQLSFAGQLTAIWPASGIAAAAVIIVGFRVWPGILIGVYLNQMIWFYKGREAIAANGFFVEFTHNSLVGLSFAVGNILEAWLIFWLVRKLIGTGNPLSKLSDVIRLMCIVPFIGPLFGALSGTLVVCGLWDWSPWSDFLSVIWTWWISAVAGILIVMPPLLWFHFGKVLDMGHTSGRRLEFFLLASAFVSIVVLAFWASLPIEYLLLLVLLWSAFRFGELTTVCVATITASVAVYATVKGYGPFVSSSIRELTVNQEITLLQCFTSTLIITAGILAAVVTEWRKYQYSLTETNATLELRVSERTQELNIAKELAENANATKSRFFAAASHDLRQPLHAMTYFVDALMIDFDRLRTGDSNEPVDPKSAAASVDRITIAKKLRETIENMRHLFNGILDISRIDAETIKIEKTDFPLSEVLRQLEREFRPIAEAASLDWRCDFTDALVHSDPILLERILRNLLDNAFKFTSKGSVSIDVERADGAMVVSVCDTGVGIEKDQQSVIFDEFYQIGKGERRGEKGLGLGLSIVRKLTDLLGQPLTLESVPGGGTTVRLPIPISSESHNAASGNVMSAPGTSASDDSVESESILIVDDDKLVAESTSSLLSLWGYDVRVATTDSDLKDCLSTQWKPQLALVDYRLDHITEMNGLEVLDYLSECIGRQIPGILMSANTQPEFLRTMKEQNYLLLSKPIRPAKLRSTIRASLRGS